MADGRMVREFVSYCGYSSLEDMLDKGIFDWPKDKFWEFKDQYGSIPLIVQEEILDLAETRFEDDGDLQETAFRFFEYVEDDYRKEEVAFNALEDNRYGIRGRAVDVLGVKSVPRLIQFLESNDLSFRQTGIDELESIFSRGDKLRVTVQLTIYETLVKALDDASFLIWETAVSGLVKYCKRGERLETQILLLLMDHPRSNNTEIIPQETGYQNRNGLTYTDAFFNLLSDIETNHLEKKNSDVLVDFMINSGLASTSGNVRRFSWYFLAKNGIQNVPHEYIASGLIDNHPSAQKNAMQYLRVVPSDDFIPLLTGKLNDKTSFTAGLGKGKFETTVRVGAFQVLAFNGGVEHLDTLINTYHTLDDNERYQVLPYIARGNWPSSAKPALINLINSEIKREKKENLEPKFSLRSVLRGPESLYDRAVASLKHIEENLHEEE